MYKPIMYSDDMLESWYSSNVEARGQPPDFCPGLPSGYVQIAIEHGHRNSELSHEKW